MRFSLLNSSMSLTVWLFRLLSTRNARRRTQWPHSTLRSSYRGSGITLKCKEKSELPSDEGELEEKITPAWCCGIEFYTLRTYLITDDLCRVCDVQVLRCWRTRLEAFSSNGKYFIHFSCHCQRKCELEEREEEGERSILDGALFATPTKKSKSRVKWKSWRLDFGKGIRKPELQHDSRQPAGCLIVCLLIPEHMSCHLFIEF